LFFLWFMAGTTGLEPATSAVTGQRSNQTELRPQKQGLTTRNLRPFIGNWRFRGLEVRGASPSQSDASLPLQQY
jgi:hypothetical protein